jgi:cell division protein FtsL
MRIILILLILVTSLMIYQNYQQRLIIDDLYQIVESHNEALIDHNFMLREIAIDNDIIFEMVEAITGKMLWEMEW